ncbi:hypothetical protein ACFXO8_37695, partial [Nocardia tengchongensis]
VYTYCTRSWVGDPVINEPHLCSALSWFPFTELPTDTMTSTRLAIEHFSSSQPSDRVDPS